MRKGGWFFKITNCKNICVYLMNWFALRTHYFAFQIYFIGLMRLWCIFAGAFASLIHYVVVKIQLLRSISFIIKTRSHTNDFSNAYNKHLWQRQLRFMCQNRRKQEIPLPSSYTPFAFGTFLMQTHKSSKWYHPSISSLSILAFFFNSSFKR